MDLFQETAHVDTGDASNFIGRALRRNTSFLLSVVALKAGILGHVAEVCMQEVFQHSPLYSVNIFATAIYSATIVLNRQSTQKGFYFSS